MQSCWTTVLQYATIRSISTLWNTQNGWSSRQLELHGETSTRVLLLALSARVSNRIKTSTKRLKFFPKALTEVLFLKNTILFGIWSPADKFGGWFISMTTCSQIRRFSKFRQLVYVFYRRLLRRVEKLFLLTTTSHFKNLFAVANSFCIPNYPDHGRIVQDFKVIEQEEKYC